MCTHHLQELVTLVEVRHNDALALWDAPVVTDELAVFAHRVDLVQRELILLILVRICCVIHAEGVLGRDRAD